ncbi:MAG: hypothetical protein SGI77_15445 [Pirellulaceae bacterium]|nr:hypothetical protein [Pirellulaceae bacterium]
MRFELPPPDTFDAVLEAYKKDVDVSLLRENLKLTVEERFLKFQRFMQSMETIRQAMLDSTSSMNQTIAENSSSSREMK